jgi:hypothetical protein
VEKNTCSYLLYKLSDLRNYTLLPSSSTSLLSNALGNSISAPHAAILFATANDHFEQGQICSVLYGSNALDGGMRFRIGVGRRA